MKKLFFLLLITVVLVGFVSASTSHPPLDYSLEMAGTVMAEYSIQENIVTQPSVLELEIPITVNPSSFYADCMRMFDIRQSSIWYNARDYYLRL